MARPKKGEEKGTSMHMGLRITPELREALDAIAQRHGRSLSDEGRFALEEHVLRHTNQPVKAKGAAGAKKARAAKAAKA